MDWVDILWPLQYNVLYWNHFINPNLIFLQFCVHSQKLAHILDIAIFQLTFFFAGLDFAWVSNGYVYHTKLDDIHQIPLGSLQRTGDNILPLILRLVNSDYLPKAQQYNKGNLVYFDFLGSFIVSGKEIFSTLINIVFIFGSAYSVWYNMNNTQSE